VQICLALVTTLLALGLVALLLSEQHIGGAQSKTTGTSLSITAPAGGVAAVLFLTVGIAFTTPTVVMANRNRPDSSPGETAAFKSAAPTAGQVNQAFRAGLA